MASNKKKPDDPDFITQTLTVRVRDKHARFLRSQAKEVNFVWNFVNELSLTHTKRTGLFMSAFDMAPYTRGSTKGEDGLSVHSQSVQAITEEYVSRRVQFRKVRLNWRVSQGSKRSLGWIPFKASAIAWRSGQLHYQGIPIKVWDSYGLSKYDLGAGSFTEDARGRWYFHTTVKVRCGVCKSTTKVGVDLGLKEAAVCSDGTRLEGRNYRKLEDDLAKAQAFGNKKKARKINERIRNKRNDGIHKLTNALSKNNAVVYCGNVDSKEMVEKGRGKSTLDAGWGKIRTQLGYKCHRAGSRYRLVDEAYSTQTCSACLRVPESSPKGTEGLSVRSWTCSLCGDVHDRDQNAAKVILAFGDISDAMEELDLTAGSGRGVARRGAESSSLMAERTSKTQKECKSCFAKGRVVSCSGQAWSRRGWR